MVKREGSETEPRRTMGKRRDQASFPVSPPKREFVQELLAQLTWYHNMEIGSDWETHVVKSLPRELRGSLPSIEEIEAELSEKGKNVRKGKGKEA